ncbi:hypothetical protein EXU85_23150 [Spirosoma sp. KCTC 42546]|uniref:iron chaperone n=1 Tax=Spirosoma sp. KCTC 42546 TaxID=2520506 RepID=UPI00115A08E3|nr:DUF1801 domain-containing protein [Spirosoma sp. KCTC 42546]QDK81349.1 hypothetical protein EXU85_23150 [Spirosoma sp. KCTC 42546]
MATTAKNSPAENIDDYIAGFPENIQQMLEAIRATIKKAAPDAEETIKYAIPTFTLNGNLVSFAAWRNHIGLYPVPRETEEFKEELSAYAGAKSTINFPLNTPLPLDLIDKIVKFRVDKTLEKAKIKPVPSAKK